MRKIIINVSSLEYAIDRGEPSHPLPLGVEWKGEVELVGRLLRTKGRGADWRAYDIDSIGFPLGNSPRLHLGGIARVETVRGRDFCHEFQGPTIQVLRRRGYEGRNFLLSVSFIGEIKDLSLRSRRAEFLRSAREHIGKGDYIHEWEQGHLKFWALSWATPELPEWIGKLPDDLVLQGKMTRILNHEIVGEKKIYWVAHNYSLVVHAPGTRLHVVSPDHLSEANTLPQGCYFFTHPEPSAD